MAGVSKTIERDTIKGKKESASRKIRARFLLGEVRRTLKEIIDLRILEMPARGQVSYLDEQFKILEHKANQDPRRFFV